MKKWMTLLLVCLTLLIFAGSFIETAVQIYTKLRLKVVITESVSIRTYVNEKEISNQVYTRERVLETIDVWILGSGVVIYSGVVRDVPKTLILTNHHVIGWRPGDKLTMNDATIFIGQRKNHATRAFEPLTLRTDATYVIMSVDGPYVVFYWSYARTNEIVFEVKAKIDAYDELLDIAVLSLENVRGLPYAKISKEDVPLGAEIFIVGAPLGIPFQITKGILGQKHLNIEYGWMDMLRYDAAQAPGSSGSGIFYNGEVIGIVRGSFVSGFSGAAYPGQHLGISATNIVEWLTLSGYQFLFE